MATLLDLANDMEKLTKSIKVYASDISVWVAKDLLYGLIHMTPVDTSRALSNWQISFNKPFTSRRATGIYHGKEGSTEEQSSDAAYKIGEIILKSKRPRDSIFISNNVMDYDTQVQYIETINARGSKYVRKVQPNWVQLNINISALLLKSKAYKRELKR